MNNAAGIGDEDRVGIGGGDRLGDAVAPLPAPSEADREREQREHADRGEHDEAAEHIGLGFARRGQREQERHGEEDDEQQQGERGPAAPAGSPSAVLAGW